MIVCKQLLKTTNAGNWQQQRRMLTALSHRCTHEQFGHRLLRFTDRPPGQFCWWIDVVSTLKCWFWLRFYRYNISVRQLAASRHYVASSPRCFDPGTPGLEVGRYETETAFLRAAKSHTVTKKLRTSPTVLMGYGTLYVPWAASP